jgi:CBS domain-containing protein
MYPALDEGRLSGCITTREVTEVPRNEWAHPTVREMARSCPLENTISPDSGVIEALSRVSRAGTSRLLVVEGNQLVRIVTLKDRLQFFALKVDLEGHRGTEKGIWTGRRSDVT